MAAYRLIDICANCGRAYGYHSGLDCVIKPGQFVLGEPSKSIIKITEEGIKKFVENPKRQTLLAQLAQELGVEDEHR